MTLLSPIFFIWVFIEFKILREAIEHIALIIVAIPTMILNNSIKIPPLEYGTMFSVNIVPYSKEEAKKLSVTEITF